MTEQRSAQDLEKDIEYCMESEALTRNAMVWVAKVIVSRLLVLFYFLCLK